MTNNFITHLSLEFSFQYLWLLCLKLPYYHIFVGSPKLLKKYFEYIYSVIDFQMSNFHNIFYLKQLLLSYQWLTWPYITQEVIYHCYYFKCFYDPICQQLHCGKTMTPIQRNVMFSSDPRLVLQISTLTKIRSKNENYFVVHTWHLFTFISVHN